MFRPFIDKIFLAFVFLVPLMPRPTAMGPERWVVPFLLTVLISVWFLFGLPNKTRNGSLQLLALVLGFPLVTYVTRMIIQDVVADEIFHAVSRSLFASGLFVMTHWLCTTSVDKKTVFRVFLYGFLATAMITIFSGLTGVQILEEDSIRPSRFLGLYKATGIFRSFGEFGIMGCVAWSYLLLFSREFKPTTWYFAIVTVSLAMLIAQSRNVYLAWAVVTGFVFLFSYVRLPTFIYASLAAVIILIPVGVELALPVLKETSFGSKLIGTGTILERNVDVRFDQFSDGVVMVSRDPSSSLLGYSREQWRQLMLETHGGVVAPHNHFLSTLVFFGLVGGFVWIFGLYLLPGIILAQSLRPDDPLGIMSLVCLLGTIVGLSFYEGFFSVVVMLTVSLAWSIAFSFPVEEFREADERYDEFAPTEEIVEPVRPALLS